MLLEKDSLNYLKFINIEFAGYFITDFSYVNDIQTIQMKKSILLPIPEKPFITYSDFKFLNMQKDTAEQFNMKWQIIMRIENFHITS